MEEPSKWYSRKHMVFLGTVLIVIGASAAIILFPTVLLFSLLFLVLISGPGIFIGYMRKKTRLMLFGALLTVSWGYAASSLFVHSSRVIVANEFYPNFLFPMLIPLALGTLPLAWFGRWDRQFDRYGSLKSAFLTWVVYMIIVVPLVYAFTWDYNIRGDTSSPEVVGLKIVDKDIDYEGSRWLTVEAPDGVLHFFLHPSSSYYDEHDVGDLVEATVHKGALGYMWIEGYS